MKFKILLPLLLLLYTFTTLGKTTIIKGKIEGKLPENLYYSAPVNGALGFDIYYTAKVDANGNFEIKTDLGEVSFIDIFYNYVPAGYIVATPGEIYGITITETDGKVTHAITCKDAELQQLYNTMLNSHRMTVLQNLAMEAAKIDDTAKFKAFYNEKEAADLKDIAGTKDGKAISKEIIQALSAERHYFYTASMSLAVYLKHLFAQREATPPSLSQFDALWNDIYTQKDLENIALNKSPWGYLYLNSYIFYKLYEEAGFDDKKVVSVDYLSSIKKDVAFMPAQNTEYYFAVKLYTGVFEGQKDKAILDAYYIFKKQYPKSSYIKYLEPKMAPLITYFAESSTMPQGAAYVEDYAQVNNIDDLIKKFPGKKLYFDIWATWCGPCRDEFKYKDALYKLLNANDITVIYLSIDKDEKDEGWKKMISHYGLQGYHIRANNDFSMKIHYMFSSDGNLSIPWYILVGSNGAIAQKYAAPPSEMEKLEAEIKTLK